MREVQDNIVKSNERVNLMRVKFFLKAENDFGDVLKKIVSFVLSVTIKRYPRDVCILYCIRSMDKGMNGLNENHVNSEIQVFFSFKMDCKEFF